MQPTKLWLDDVRDCPPGFLLARTAYVAIQILKKVPITFISFDHDLGEGETGYNVACFIEEGAYNGTIKRMEWAVHSANPVGRANIERAMRSAERAWKQTGESCVSQS